MKIIGITGGIGSGKSTVLKLLREKYQAYIVEADKVAHELMEPGQEAYEKIKETFPETIFNADGRINRTTLGNLVFQNPDWLNRLNGIVHPAVKTWILNEIGQQKQNHICTLFVIEAALLIEDGYTEICDEIWYVYAEESVRVKRLMESRGYSLDKCRAVMQNQSEEAYYRKNTSARIDNSLTFAETEKQVDALLKS